MTHIAPVLGRQNVFGIEWGVQGVWAKGHSHAERANPP